MRGEKLHRHDQQPAGLGSPPRARGKDGGEYAWDGYTGITPACAGKSSLYASFSRSSWDHPRVRGEKSMYCILTPSNRGSPPRARGKVELHNVCRAEAGITPACAGKSRAAVAVDMDAEDHPRVRGEKKDLLDDLTARGGSPPRARGKVKIPVSHMFPFGITPACAGKRG